jgi:hypothetical protein
MRMIRPTARMPRSAQTQAGVLLSVLWADDVVVGTVTTCVVVVTTVVGLITTAPGDVVVVVAVVDALVVVVSVLVAVVVSVLVCAIRALAPMPPAATIPTVTIVATLINHPRRRRPFDRCLRVTSSPL